MVFTPLLASTAVGTLEFRSVALPVRDIQRALAWPQNHYISSSAVAVNAAAHEVQCRSADGLDFRLPYDQLVIATGAAGSTFGIPGVYEHAHFLRDVGHASAIRKRIIECLSLAATPGRPMSSREALLHIVIVGGGPTGVEVAGEICDFTARDMRRLYPALARDMRVTLVEGRDILASFDVALHEYAARHLTRNGVHLLKGVVKEVKADRLYLKDGRELKFGLCIWSTGVGPTHFIEALPFAKTNVGRLAVNGHMQVLVDEGQDLKEPSQATSATIDAAEVTGTSAKQGMLRPCPDIYALGDCCADFQQPLAPLAQVAEQQGRYLAATLNRVVREQGQGALASGAATSQPAFQYRHLGSMASIGHHTAVIEVGGPPQRSRGPPARVRGLSAWLAWRSAYLTRLGSFKKRLEVASDWTLTLLFGRDTSRW